MLPDITSFVTWYIALIVAMVCHEAAHAWVAMLGGDRTAYEAGQVTINPIPHIQREPFGMVLLPILTFAMMGFPMGFAHAPYSPYWADSHPRRAAVMSAAGPLANLLLAALFFAFLRIGFGLEWFERPYEPATTFRELMETLLVGSDAAEGGMLDALARISSVLLSINLILGVFNLIPIPPLDGAGIAEGLLPGPLGGFFRFLRGNQMFAIVGILVAFRLGGEVIWPVFLWMLHLLRV